MNRTAVPAAQLIERLVVGGAETLAARLAAGLAARGAASWLYALQPGGPLADRLGPGVRHRDLHLRRASVRRPWAFPGSLARARSSLLARLRADGVAVLQTHLPEANFWGLLAGLGRPLPVVATVHSNDEFHYGPTDGPVRRAARRQAYRLLLRRADAVVAVSAQVRDSLARELGLTDEAAAAITVIPNAVAVPPPLPEAERRALRRELGVASGEIVLLGAGRLTDLKNHGDLVELTARLRAAGHPVRTLIAGEGEERAALQARIAAAGLDDHVRLLGLRDDLARLDQAADLFVLTSRWEGLPLVALEAMAAGCPVLAYRIAGTADLITSGQDGVLVPPDDVAALARAAAELIADPDGRRRLARAGHALVRRDYDFDTALDRLAGLHAEVVQRHARRRGR